MRKGQFLCLIAGGRGLPRVPPFTYLEWNQIRERCTPDQEGVKILAFIKNGLKISSTASLLCKEGLLGEASLQIRRGTSDTFIEPPGPVKGTVAPCVERARGGEQNRFPSFLLDNISGIMGDEEIEDQKNRKSLPFKRGKKPFA